MRRAFYWKLFVLETAAVAFMILQLSTVAARPQGQHKDQPKSCDNAHDNPHKCDCERAQHDCDPNNQYATQKCKTYCRPEACKCANPCNSD